VTAARLRWQDEQLRFDPAKLVFIDESGISTETARLYGRAPSHPRRRPRPIRALEAGDFVQTGAGTFIRQLPKYIFRFTHGIRDPRSMGK
jgi:hypothetical protein